MSSSDPPIPLGNVRQVIDKLASFVARNGQEFEQMTKEKQRNNPDFAFLFDGQHSDYYRWRIQQEQRLAATQEPAANGPKPMKDAEIQELFYIHVPKLTSDNSRAAFGVARKWVLSRCTSSDHADQLALLIQKNYWNQGTSIEQRVHLVYLVSDILHHSRRKRNSAAVQSFRGVLGPMLQVLNAADLEHAAIVTKLMTMWKHDGLFDVATLSELKTQAESGEATLYNPGTGSADSAPSAATEPPQRKGPISFSLGTRKSTNTSRAVPPRQINTFTSETTSASEPQSQPRSQQPPRGQHQNHQKPAQSSQLPQATNLFFPSESEAFEPLTYGQGNEKPCHQRPAGLIVPLVTTPDVDFDPVDPGKLRDPALEVGDDNALKAAVEEYYAPAKKPRDGEGWEEGALADHYRAKNRYESKRRRRSRSNSRDRSRGRSQSPKRNRMRGYSRSRSRSPPRSSNPWPVQRAAPDEMARPGLGAPPIPPPRPAHQGLGAGPEPMDAFAQFRQAKGRQVTQMWRSHRPDLMCYQCGTSGHLARDCPG